MSDSVFVTVADTAYLPHAKSLFVNAVRQGNWKGEFCLICADDTDTSSIEGRGIDILRVTERRCAMKWRLFDPYFKRWNRLLFLDCDSLVQDDLAKCEKLAEQFPSIFCDGSQLTTILEDWAHFGRVEGAAPEDLMELYERLQARFPHVHDRLYGSSAFYFSPADVASGTLGDILAVQEEFKELNPGGYDQQVTGLVLHKQLVRASKDYFIWWAFDDPGNRVASEVRGWTGKEEPVALHYWHTFAPWLEKKEDDASRINHRLGRVCLELYRENLAAFETVFPLREESGCQIPLLSS